MFGDAQRAIDWGKGALGAIIPFANPAAHADRRCRSAKVDTVGVDELGRMLDLASTSQDIAPMKSQIGFSALHDVSGGAQITDTVWRLGQLHKKAVRRRYRLMYVPHRATAAKARERVAEWRFAPP
jgi:hypothetical protein